MAKKIEVAERKLTTSAGLDALMQIVEKLQDRMADDIPNFKATKRFFCRVEEDNGLLRGDWNYVSWVLSDAVFVYRDGYIKILIDDDCHKPVCIVTGHGCSGHSFYDERIEKIDFAGAVESLTELVTSYNEKATSKDAEIERFLNFCRDF